MSTWTDLSLAIIVGITLAAGLYAMAGALPRWRAASLNERVVPFIRDIVPLHTTADLIAAPRWSLRSTLRDLRTQAITALGAGEALQRRLTLAGSTLEPAAFRAQQLVWAITGVIGGAGFVVLLAMQGRMTPPTIIIPVLAGTASLVLRDALLTRQATQRRARLGEELPTTLEFIALCLAAGETPLAAFERVADVGSGELSRELAAVVVAVRTGSPLEDALRSMARAIDLPALSRAVDQLTAAIERGAPLAAVLHDQAADCREEAQRSLIEQAGRKELLMMLPLVFLILPLSVLFAIYPGVLMLRLGLG
ncbi:type II secretion system F family protein [Microbacterium sp. YY-01]|uniref:type II secretion system F family protein n=1 Tax=Microbacterium sp. YY-01 TaxID=3421634 RepID=UPI003D164780